jgi:hypothetical protein
MSEGLYASNDVCTSANPQSSYFIRKDEPIIVDTLIANEIITEEIDLDGGILTTTGSGTVLLLNGLPVGGGIVNSVTGTAPIAVTGTATDPVVSLNNSGVVPATYTVATVTVDSKGLITSASSNVIPPNDDWSSFPALTNVNMNNFQLNNLLAPSNNNDATTKIYVDTLDGQNVKLTGNQSIAGIKTFSSLPESVVVPTTNAQLVNKLYVDTLPLPPTENLDATLTAGNSAGANQINMNSNKIINCLDPTLAQDVATKNYVDTLPTPTLSAVLTAGNIASADINMNDFDISAVNDITMSGLVPSITATNVLGNMVISASNTMNIATIGSMTLAGGGIVSIGGATHTTIENMRINNSAITKESGADLTLANIASVANTGATLSIGGTSVNDNLTVSMAGSGATRLVQTGFAGVANPLLKLEAITSAAPGTYIELYHNSSAPTTLDRTGVLTFQGNNSAAAKVEYGRIRNRIIDPTSTSRDSDFDFFVAKNNVMTSILNIQGDGIKPIAIVDTVGSTAGSSGQLLTSTGTGTEWVDKLTNETLTTAGTISNSTDISFLEGIGDYTLPNGLFNGQRKLLASTTLTPVSQANLFGNLVGSLDLTSQITSVAYDAVNEWVYISGSFQMGPNGRRQLRFFVYDIVNDVFSDINVTNGANGTIECMLLDGSVLYVGGSFTSVAGVANTNRFAIWTPTGFGTGSWTSPAGTEIPNGGSVFSIEKYGTEIAIGGSFPLITGVANTNRLALYNPATSSFSAIGTGTSTSGNPEIRALYADGTRLYIGGNFANLGGVAGTGSIGYWDGSVFVRMGQGHEGSPIFTIDKLGTDIIIGGSFDGGFRQTTFARVNAPRIIRWNTVTENYSTIGQGFGNSVEKVYVRPSSGELMAVGVFTEDGSRRGGFQRVAIYDAVNNIWNTFGGVDGIVKDLVELSSGSVLVVGGFANGMGAIGGFGYSGAQIIDPGFFMRVNGAFSGVNGTKATLQFTGAGPAVTTFECVWNAVSTRWMITNNANLPTR